MAVGRWKPKARHTQKNDRKICGFYCLSSTSFSQDLMSHKICLPHCIKGDKASYFFLGTKRRRKTKKIYFPSMQWKALSFRMKKKHLWICRRIKYHVSWRILFPFISFFSVMKMRSIRKIIKFHSWLLERHGNGIRESQKKRKLRNYRDPSQLRERQKFFVEVINIAKYFPLEFFLNRTVKVSLLFTSLADDNFENTST